MLHDVNQRKVEAACQDTLRQLGNGGLNHGEVLLALSESIGRMIVHSCKTPIQMQEMANIVGQHIARTLDAGAQAKGFRGTNEGE